MLVAVPSTPADGIWDPIQNVLWALGKQALPQIGTAQLCRTWRGDLNASGHGAQGLWLAQGIGSGNVMQGTLLRGK